MIVVTMGEDGMYIGKFDSIRDWMNDTFDGSIKEMNEELKSFEEINNDGKNNNENIEGFLKGYFYCEKDHHRYFQFIDGNNVKRLIPTEIEIINEWELK